MSCFVASRQLDGSLHHVQLQKSCLSSHLILTLTLVMVTHAHSVPIPSIVLLSDWSTFLSGRRVLRVDVGSLTHSGARVESTGVLVLEKRKED